MRLKLIIIALCFLFAGSMSAKKYKFELSHSYEVVHTANQGDMTKIFQVYAYGKNADKAIDQAKQDVIAAVIFTGAPGYRNEKNAESVEETTPLVPNAVEAYDQHKKFFDNFFSSGEYMRFVQNVNRDYPVGKDNIQTDKGRRVRVILAVNVKALNDYLNANGIGTQGHKLQF